MSELIRKDELFDNVTELDPKQEEMYIMGKVIATIDRQPTTTEQEICKKRPSWYQGIGVRFLVMNAMSV